MTKLCKNKDIRIFLKLEMNKSSFKTSLSISSGLLSVYHAEFHIEILVTATL